MKWVTRERPKVDRIACPWLIKRFVDPEAEFLYVPATRSRPWPSARALRPTTSLAPSWDTTAPNVPSTQSSTATAWRKRAGAQPACADRPWRRHRPARPHPGVTRPGRHRPGFQPGVRRRPATARRGTARLRRAVRMVRTAERTAGGCLIMSLQLRGHVTLPPHASGGFDHGDVHAATGRVSLRTPPMTAWT